MPSREHDVAALDDIPVGGMLGVTAGSENVLLTRDDGAAYAVGGICPHAGGPLAEGVRQDTWGHLSLAQGEILPAHRCSVGPAGCGCTASLRREGRRRPRCW